MQANYYHHRLSPNRTAFLDGQRQVSAAGGTRFFSPPHSPLDAASDAGRVEAALDR
uniref:Uncharacterized protein n=1 Tax=Anguilla anguilla TaxID=7936 RepID=A0A0E9R071_ANGAN